MTRPHQLLQPQVSPVPARPASTLLLLRDAPDPTGGAGATRLEVLISRRSDKARFAASNYVFPGGSIDADDALHHEQLAARAQQGAAELTIAQAAIRETFEELGILLARHADGRWASQADLERIDRAQPLLPQCRQQGLTLAADALWMLAHWITPLEGKIRFDVPFVAARMPEGQTAVADEAEQFETLWIAPADALQHAADGTLSLMFPTIETFRHLSRYPNAQAVLEVLQAQPPGQPLWRCLPRKATKQGELTRFMEHESAYGELALVSPDGQMQPPIDWQHEQAVPLARNLLRLTAANPGVMTGPGTNSYLVGDAATGYIAIDPGPNQPEHQQRLFDAAGGDIRAIICTHSHADHSPGAAPLQALVAASGRPAPVIWGLPSASTARPSSQFRPDQVLSDGQRVALPHPGGPEHSHTLRAIHTPGHAANHVCLVLEEDGLLFSGDHILNGSTTIIDPPDGNMHDYLASLAKLDAACEQGGIGFILPAHGYALQQPRQIIAHLRAHRLAREEKVRAAMAAAPDGTPDDWVRIAYADTPPRLWPAAMRSLLAHVEHIRTVR